MCWKRRKVTNRIDSSSWNRTFKHLIEIPIRWNMRFLAVERLRGYSGIGQSRLTCQLYGLVHRWRSAAQLQMSEGSYRVWASWSQDDQRRLRRRLGLKDWLSVDLTNTVALGVHLVSREGIRSKMASLAHVHIRFRPPCSCDLTLLQRCWRGSISSPAMQQISWLWKQAMELK